MAAAPRKTARTLIDRHGTTYAQEAGIRLADKPSPLYRLLVLATLLSARIDAGIAVAAARELRRYRSPRTMLAASWQDRVDALGRGHYRRYDERTATMLGDGAQLLLEDHRGDLRRLHAQSSGVRDVEQALQRFPGIGAVGAAIFCREVQGTWSDLAPYVDDRAAAGARRLGLPTGADDLAALVPAGRFTALVAGCVRAALDDDVVRDVTG